jgi:hypothetical protein
MFGSCYIVDTIYASHTEKSVFIPCELDYNIDVCKNNIGFVIPCDNDITYDTTNCPNIKMNDVCNFRKCDIKCEYYKCQNNMINVSIMNDNIYLPTLTTASISDSSINAINICIYLLILFILY